MRTFLDRLYFGSAVLAALGLVAIFTLVMLQVLGRLLDLVLKLIGVTPFGLLIPSIAEIGGYLLAMSSFLALAYTLTTGGHIRVGILVDRLQPATRRIVEGLVGFAAVGLSAFATYAVGLLALKSWTFNDVSYGFIPIPLWIPQAAMTLGLAILTIAVIDVTLKVWRGETVMPGGSEV